MKLYYMPAACSLSPHIVANELGLDVEFVRVDHIDRKTEQGRDFHQVNPHGYIPVLELDDGRLLQEGPVIVQYLADRKPEAGLVPPHGSFERYKLQEMLSFLSTEIHKGFIPLLYAREAGDYINTARPRLEKRFAWIDGHLADREFLMGNRFTVADAYLFALTNWGQAAWLKSYYHAPIHFDGLINLENWHRRVSGRPSVRQSLVEEGLEHS